MWEYEFERKEHGEPQKEVIRRNELQTYTQRRRSQKLKIITNEEKQQIPHWFGPKSKTSKGKGHPIMYGKPKSSIHFTDFPDGGGYPKGFLEWAFEIMKVDDPNQVLHLCSGSVVSGIRIDIRPETKPDVVCDCRETPFKDESFDFILADPPYSESYAENLYGTGKHYPKPGEILKEASRLLKPGGKVGLLHFVVPMIRKPLKIVGVYGITTGSGYAIRAWTLCEKIVA